MGRKELERGRDTFLSSFSFFPGPAGGECWSRSWRWTTGTGGPAAGDNYRVASCPEDENR